MISLEPVPLQFGSCPPGYRIDQDKCFPCPPGTYTSGQEAECFRCPKHFFMSRERADFCVPCPEGKKTISEGADSESACIYFDSSGNPVPTIDTKLIIILTCVFITIICICIIAILLLKYYKKKKVPPESDQEKADEISNDEEEYTYTDYDQKSESKDHIYEEIDYEDLYEEPIKPSKKRGHTKTQSETELHENIDTYDNPDDHIYAEIGDYEPTSDSEPIYVNLTPKKSEELTEENAYEVPLKPPEHVDPRRSEEFEDDAKPPEENIYDEPPTENTETVYHMSRNMNRLKPDVSKGFFYTLPMLEECDKNMDPDFVKILKTPCNDCSSDECNIRGDSAAVILRHLGVETRSFSTHNSVYSVNNNIRMPVTFRKKSWPADSVLVSKGNCSLKKPASYETALTIKSKKRRKIALTVSTTGPTSKSKSSTKRNR